MQTKAWYESKTVWVNILIGLAAVGSFVAGDDFPVQLSGHTIEAILLGVAIINTGLRFITRSIIK